MPDGATARLERTAAVQRALRVRRPDEDLDDVVDSLFGSWWVDGPEVGFAPSATVTVPRLPGRSGAARDPAGASRDRGRRRRRPRRRPPEQAGRRDPPYAACWPPCGTGCATPERARGRWLTRSRPSWQRLRRRRWSSSGTGAVGLASPGPAAREEPWDLAVVVVRDRLDLRALASGLTTSPGRGPGGPPVAVWLEASPALLPRAAVIPAPAGRDALPPAARRELAPRCCASPLPSRSAGC